MGYVLLTLLMLVGCFLMFVILLQRGRGGGLAGAFGGLGGQSAFGTKAGDVFTVITIVTVVVWVLLACLAGWRLRVEASPESFLPDRDEITSVEPEADKGNSKKGDEKDDAAGQTDKDEAAGSKDGKTESKATKPRASGGREAARGAKDDGAPSLPDDEPKKNDAAGKAKADNPSDAPDGDASEKPSSDDK